MTKNLVAAFEARFLGGWVSEDLCVKGICWALSACAGGFEVVGTCGESN